MVSTPGHFLDELRGRREAARAVGNLFLRRSRVSPRQPARNGEPISSGAPANGSLVRSEWQDERSASVVERRPRILSASTCIARFGTSRDGRNQSLLLLLVITAAGRIGAEKLKSGHRLTSMWRLLLFLARVLLTSNHAMVFYRNPVGKTPKPP